MFHLIPTTNSAEKLAKLCEGKTVSDNRKTTLAKAIELGADEAALIAIRDTIRTSKSDTMILPAGRYENMSRGKGWCRQGKGAKAVWGDREDNGYRVGPGRWVVGCSDGFSRKDETVWAVKNITVGEQTWTIAN